MADPARTTLWRWWLAAGLGAVAAYVLSLSGDATQAAIGLLLYVAAVLAGVAGVLSHRQRTDVSTAQELGQLALRDRLTGLGSRELLLDRLEAAVGAAAREGTQPGLVVLDLDGFREVNETFGHGVGDALLSQAAGRIQRVVGTEGLAARLGSDEFAVLLPDGGVEAASAVGRRALQVLAEPYRVNGRDLVVRADAGAAGLAPGESSEDLVRHADAAMYASRDQGMGELLVFAPEHHAGLLHRLSLATDLRSAVRKGQLSLDYQPIVEMASGRAVGVEALVRWAHPVRGRIPPDEFIPLAEHTGTIHELGRWVLETACRQVGAWSRAGHEVYVSVNLSGAQLRNVRLVEEVRDVLDRNGLAPEALVLEITESSVVEDVEHTIPALQRLRDAGIVLAIDDFGTGYSSLSSLRRLPVGIVKIDRSFVAGITAESAEWAVALAIVRLIESLGMQAVAEGVETGAQLAHLRSLGYELAQGYYFARPGSADEVAGLLSSAIRG